MLASSIPTKFPIPWGNSASPSLIRNIPVASQIGIQDGAASLTDGFVPDNFDPEAAGGIPPFGQDFNGILRQVTQWLQWSEAGGPIKYDGTFATNIGGYPNGAFLQSNTVPGRFWVSTIDNNLTDPDSTSAANWQPPAGMSPVGAPIASLSSAAVGGSVPANALTIGNPSSNATQRANSDTLLLYRYVWTSFSNSQCPLLNSAGSPISRGANPDADFTANNQLTLPNAKGLSLIGVDGMGGAATTFLNGVPVTIGNTTTPGSIFGENLHALITAENAQHNHGITDPTHTHTHNAKSTTNNNGVGSGAVLSSTIGATINAAATGITVNNSGSGTAHNTVHRAMGVYWNLAL